jgi:hypothetical protein
VVVPIRKDLNDLVKNFRFLPMRKKNMSLYSDMREIKQTEDSINKLIKEKGPLNNEKINQNSMNFVDLHYYNYINTINLF